MGMWKWDGLDAKGKRAHGQLQAANEKEARKILRGMGVRPKSIVPPSILEFDLAEWMVEAGFAKAFGKAELGLFTKQLSIMVNAGVPILQSLEILGQQEKNISLRRAIKNIYRSVAEGNTLAESMAKERGFDKLYCNLVKAGETGGILDTILDKLAQHMERQEKLKAQIKSAMMYPAIVVIVGIAVVYGMMVFVVPQFTDMLKDTGQEPPWITQMVIDISNFLRDNTVYVLGAIALLVTALKVWIGTPPGKIAYDVFSMRMPLFGGIVIKGNLSSFTRTLSTMLSSGVAVVDALAICIETIDNSVIATDIGGIKKAVMEGKTFSEPLKRIDYFPPMVCQMIKVGEQTGSIDQMLLKIANVFEEEINVLMSGLTKLIEPIILVVLGGIVAVILVAMYLPIFMSAGGGDSF